MTNKTAATRYGRALLDVAVHEKIDLEQVERDLSAFVDLFARNPTLSQVMLNPAVPVPRKSAVMAELTSRAGAVPVVTKLLALLASRDRLVLLPELLAAFRERLLDYQKVVKAHITTAVPLAPERTLAIQERFAGLTGRTVRLDTSVDPAIIGGVVARIGSTVYDGSVTRQLEKMKARLIEGT